MYVCNCNGLNERAVSRAIAAGCDSPAAIYRHHGCAPQCGKCAGEIYALLRAGGGRPVPPAPARMSPAYELTCPALLSPMDLAAE